MSATRILPRFDFRVQVASDTVVGSVRKLNEDALLLAPELALFGAADGIGGLHHGDIAAQLALESARQFLADKAAQRATEAYAKAPTLERRREVFGMLRAACDAAHARLHEEQARRGATMGTTLDLCLLVRDAAFIAHVGDGRVYLCRPRAVLQLTEDHVVRPVRGASVPPSQRPKSAPLANGIGLATALRVDCLFVELHKGDTVALLTDGAYGPYADEASLGAALRSAPCAAVSEAVTRHSVARGGRDNATILLVRIEERLVVRTEELSPHSGRRENDRDDTETLRHCPLFVGLSTQQVLAALAAGIEVELEQGKTIKPNEANDLCAYVLLEGSVEVGPGPQSPPAIVFAASLAGVDKSVIGTALERTRCVRFRCDDFQEVAANDPALGVALLQRLAGYLARS